VSDSFKKGKWAGDQWNPSDDDDELPAAPRGPGLSADDRALLELAARAIGARFEEVEQEGYGNLHFEDGRVLNAWNSLQFSGDAFELAVELDISMSGAANTRFAEGEYGPHSEEAVNGDKLSAARRAITRAAAERVAGERRYGDSE